MHRPFSTQTSNVRIDSTVRLNSTTYFTVFTISLCATQYLDKSQPASGLRYTGSNLRLISNASFILQSSRSFWCKMKGVIHEANAFFRPQGHKCPGFPALMTLIRAARILDRLVATADPGETLPTENAAS